MYHVLIEQQDDGSWRAWLASNWTYGSLKLRPINNPHAKAMLADIDRERRVTRVDPLTRLELHKDLPVICTNWEALPPPPPRSPHTPL